eukprot:9589693-Prorocentrum_lima.AAC.1
MPRTPWHLLRRLWADAVSEERASRWCRRVERLTDSDVFVLIERNASAVALRVEEGDLGEGRYAVVLRQVG